MGSFKDASRRLHKLAREIARGEENLIQTTGEDLYDTARRFTSGSLLPKDLARMDHPYAMRHGTPRLNPGYLNIKTGAVFNAWVLQFRRTTNGRMAVVFNTDEIAREFLEPGTFRMFVRPVADQVMANVRPRFEARKRFLIQKMAQS